jgi:hypothetical protein
MRMLREVSTRTRTLASRGRSAGGPQSAGREQHQRGQDQRAQGDQDASLPRRQRRQRPPVFEERGRADGRQQHHGKPPGQRIRETHQPPFFFAAMALK